MLGSFSDAAMTGSFRAYFTSRKRTIRFAPGALGQKQTFALQHVMSGLPPKAIVAGGPSPPFGFADVRHK
jgi:hypothetical protein